MSLFSATGAGGDFSNPSELQGTGADSGVFTLETENYTQDVFVNMDTNSGGWMMVASDHAQDTTLPTGTNIFAKEYEVNRPNRSGPFTSDIFSEPSPNGDYIIGPAIDEVSWSEALLVMWHDDNNFDSTFQDYVNRNVSYYGYFILDSADSSNSDKLACNVGRGYVSENGNISVSNEWNHTTVDLIKSTRLSGNGSGNDNQCTLGMAGGKQDSQSYLYASGGTYLGHDNTGNSHPGQGWINGGANDGTGYVTFVR